MKLVVKLRMLSKSAVLVERWRRSHRWWRSARQTLETRLNLHQLRNVRPEKLLPKRKLSPIPTLMVNCQGCISDFHFTDSSFKYNIKLGNLYIPLRLKQKNRVGKTPWVYEKNPNVVKIGENKYAYQDQFVKTRFPHIWSKMS